MGDQERNRIEAEERRDLEGGEARSNTGLSDRETGKGGFNKRGEHGWRRQLGINKEYMFNSVNFHPIKPHISQENTAVSNVHKLLWDNFVFYKWRCLAGIRLIWYTLPVCPWVLMNATYIFWCIHIFLLMSSRGNIWSGLRVFPQADMCHNVTYMA